MEEINDLAMGRNEDEEMSRYDPTNQVRAALDTAEMIRYEGDKLTPSDVNWDDVDDADEALELWRFAQMQKLAAAQVARVAAEQLAKLLKEGGAAAYGDSIVRYKKQRTEYCIDPRAFIQYLTMQVKSDFVDLTDVINPNNAKVSWMDKAVRQTFFDWKNGEPALSITPREKAPLFLQTLNEGEIMFGKDED